MDIITQQKKILSYCQINGSITVRDAVMIGINSPTKRISEMMRDPRYTVDKETVVKYDGEGNFQNRFVRYRIGMAKVPMIQEQDA